MNTSILDCAAALSDGDLLARVETLAGTERETAAELVAHLAALELRPNAFAARGYGSLFDYCTQALRLSEDAACTRIRAARTCRSFPVVLDLLSSGAVSLTTIRLLQPHLTPENHQAVLARAANKRRDEIQALVAELAPQPDVLASVRKLPDPQRPRPSVPEPTLIFAPEASSVPSSATSTMSCNDRSAPAGPDMSTRPLTAPLDRPRPIVRASAPQRYRVQFTIGQETHDKLRRLQALVRRENPSGDVAMIFEQAVELMLEKVERAKIGAKTRRSRTQSAGTARHAYEKRIRFRTDDPGEGGEKGSRPPSRHIPNAVKRAVWHRDGAQCAFVSEGGRRCTERAFLELHHVQPYALGGPPSLGNIALRCRRHNSYEAAVVFGPRAASTMGEADG